MQQTFGTIILLFSKICPLVFPFDYPLPFVMFIGLQLSVVKVALCLYVQKVECMHLAHADYIKIFNRSQYIDAIQNRYTQCHFYYQRIFHFECVWRLQRFLLACLWSGFCGFGVIKKRMRSTLLGTSVSGGQMATTVLRLVCLSICPSVRQTFKVIDELCSFLVQ